MSNVTSILTGREVPKDLAGLPGVSSGFNPPSIYECRFVILGQPGAGKSTLLNSCDRIAILDPEGGGRTVSDPQAIRFTAPPQTPIEQLDKAYLQFAERIIARKLAGKTDILMLGVDTIDKLIDIFLTSICARAGVDDPLQIDGGSGNGYTKVRQDIWGMLDRAARAGLGWGLLAHTTVEVLTSGDTSRQVTCPAVSKSFRAPLMRECEHMLFLERGVVTETVAGPTKVVRGKEYSGRTTTVTHPVRKLRTAPGGLVAGGETSDVKVRIDLPPQIILPPVGGFQVLSDAYNRAVETRRAGQVIATCTERRPDNGKAETADGSAKAPVRSRFARGGASRAR